MPWYTDYFRLRYQRFDLRRLASKVIRQTADEIHILCLRTVTLSSYQAPGIEVPATAKVEPGKGPPMEKLLRTEDSSSRIQLLS
jgi:hypothetical protein